MSSLAQPARSSAWRDLIVSEAVRDRATPWLLFLAALGTRFYHIAANGLRTDEMYSVWMAARPLPDMLRAIVLEGHDATPPTYYVLLHTALSVSWDLWAIRLASVLAGALLVVLAYRLARHLLGYSVALLSGALLVISPFSIEVAQVARAYAVASVLAIGSLYLFVRLRPPTVPQRTVWLYAGVTLAALSTHYLTAVVVMFQNAVVLTLFVFGQLPRRKFVDWIKLQALMGLVALPLLWMALQRLPSAGDGTGQDWLPRPSAAGIVKSLIMWATGDPSFGPATFTLARLASLLVVVALLAVGVYTAWRLWHTQPERRLEVRRAAFVAAAFFGIWGLALGISLVRKVFSDKYFIYLAPLLLILLAWAGLRGRPLLLARGLLIALVVLTGQALVIYYTSPAGEQWREAMAFVRQTSEPGDYVVTTPGYYIRPAIYYLTGQMAPVDYTLARAPIAVLGPGGYAAATAPIDDESGTLPALATVLGSAERIWLVTGYADLDDAWLNWFYDNYQVVGVNKFLGVQVTLLQRQPVAGGLALPRGGGLPLAMPLPAEGY